MVERSQQGARGHLLEYPRSSHDLRPHAHHGDHRFPSMKIPVDSPLVMRNSRHAITEAGFDTIVENLRKSAERSGERPLRSGRAQLSRYWKSRLVSTGPATISCAERPRAKPGTSTSTAHSLLPCMVVAQDSRR